jgi:hypothetical protein
MSDNQEKKTNPEKSLNGNTSLPPVQQNVSVPHMAIITVRGVVNRQMPGGMWHPTATLNEGFNIQFEGKSAKEVVAFLRNKLAELERQCQMNQPE